MALPLEDHALIGDMRSAALVGVDGSIDWLCLPRFDSESCFAALLGSPEHGRWLLAPAGGHRATMRRHRDDTLVLETEFTTADGTVRVVDCMQMQLMYEVEGERRAVRAAAGAAHRPRPARRGVRPGRRSAGRELPAGAEPPRTREHRARPRFRYRPEPLSECALRRAPATADSSPFG